MGMMAGIRSVYIANDSMHSVTERKSTTLAHLDIYVYVSRNSIRTDSGKDKILCEILGYFQYSQICIGNNYGKILSRCILFSKYGLKHIRRLYKFDSLVQGGP